MVIDLTLRLASGARAAAAVVAFAVGGTLLFRLSPYDALKGILGGPSLPEETITNPDRLAQTLETLGPAGRDAYLQFQLWDVINPVLMGLAGAMLLGWMLQRSGRSNSAWRLVVLVPFVLLLADLLENVVIARALVAYPDGSAFSNALPVVTAVKFGAAISMALSVVVLVFLWTRDRLVGRARSSGVSE